jgi:hypothetical protein
MGTETIKSSKTRPGYLYGLWLVCDRLHLNPDELVTHRVRDMAEQDFLKRQRLEEEIRKLKAEVALTGESKAFQMVASVCSFLKANTGSRLNIVNTQPEVKFDAWQYEGDPAKEQVFWQNIANHAPNLRDAAAFTVGLECGARDGSLLKMTVGDVAAEFKTGTAPYKILIRPPGESPKKKSGGVGFIGEDARGKIDAYFALRKRRGFSCEFTDPFLVDLETGKPLAGIDMLNESLRRAFLDAGALSHDQVYPPDARMSPVRWYSLRKRAQTIMEDNTDGSGIALNWVDVLMCHKPRGAQGTKYSRPSPQQLREAYSKAMHRLEIYTPAKPEASKDEIRRHIRGEMERLAQELQKLETRTVTATDLARIIRGMTAVEAEAV